MTDFRPGFHFNVNLRLNTIKYILIKLFFKSLYLMKIKNILIKLFLKVYINK